MHASINKPKFMDWSQIKRFESWYAEPKLDGQRCLLESRGGLNWLKREGGRGFTW